MAPFTKTVNCKTLFVVICTDEGDWNFVIMECSALAGQWGRLGSFLGLDPSSIAIIRENNPRDQTSCFSEAISQWIKQNYNTARYGMPSWRTLLRAVAMVDKLLFQKLAIKHGTCNKFSKIE